MNNLHYNQILNTAISAGQIMLQSGGEMYRVEETMNRIALAFGAFASESYATPTTIILTIHNEEGTGFSNMRRINERSVNLGRVDDINRVSRAVEKEGWDIAQTQAKIDEIACGKAIGLKVLLPASALAVAAFTIIFGGAWQDAACGLATGLLLRLCIYSIQKLKLNQFFVNMSGGFLAFFISWLFYVTGLCISWNTLALSTMMLLVPGLLLTNAFRDIVAGDLISGVSRTIEAITVAAALAAGAAFAYYVLMLIGGAT